MSAKMQDLVEQLEIEAARQRVADRYVHDYHKRAILRGDWDAGSIMRDEIAALRDERSE